MKIAIVLTDDKGQTLQGEVELKPSNSESPVTRKGGSKVHQNASVTFSIPIRAFVKKHARGLSGPGRFAVLVAYLCKGKLGIEVSNSEVEEHWNKMKPLLGGKKLNGAHATRAKEHGWIDSRSRGRYVLCPDWKGALNG